MPADVRGKKIVVTAGGNREPIDPIRFIGNRSSGKMGFALADVAQERGAVVTLITTTSPPEPWPRRYPIFGLPNLLGRRSRSKVRITIELVENEDFLLELPDDIVKVGFAAETQDLLANAEKKLIAKRLDFICANDVTAPDAGFGVDTNRIAILHSTGEREELPLMSKHAVAHEIINRIVPLL